MAVDPKIGATLLAEGTAQAEIVVNEMLARILATRMSVKSRVLTAPPGSETNFDSYIIAGSATGDWSGRDTYIAIYVDGYIYVAPQLGMKTYDENASEWVEWNGSAWTAVSGGGELPVGTSVLCTSGTPPTYGTWAVDASNNAALPPAGGFDWYYRSA